jgi:hypothetical protein
MREFLVVVLVVFELFCSKAIIVTININITVVGFQGFRKIATETEKNIPKKKHPKKTVGETK